MKYISEKVEEGLLDLSKVPTETLRDWLADCECAKDRDAIGCEILYRVGRY